jgi:hypothetical protein
VCSGSEKLSRVIISATKSLLEYILCFRRTCCTRSLNLQPFWRVSAFLMQFFGWTFLFKIWNVSVNHILGVYFSMRCNRVCLQCVTELLYIPTEHFQACVAAYCNANCMSWTWCKGWVLVVSWDHWPCILQLLSGVIISMNCSCTQKSGESLNLWNNQILNKIIYEMLVDSELQEVSARCSVESMTGFLRHIM